METAHRFRRLGDVGTGGVVNPTQMRSDSAFVQLTIADFAAKQCVMIKIANILVVGRRMGRMV
jgi:hypothetical protein